MRNPLTAEQIPDLPEHWRSYAQSALAQSEESLVGCNPHTIHLVTLCLLAEIAGLNVMRDVKIRGAFEIQRAHDVLHSVILGVIDIGNCPRSQAACHSAHDTLGWILQHPCGKPFETNLAVIEALADDQGLALRARPGPPSTDAEREQGS